MSFVLFVCPCRQQGRQAVQVCRKGQRQAGSRVAEGKGRRQAGKCQSACPSTSPVSCARPCHVSSPCMHKQQKLQTHPSECQEGDRERRAWAGRYVCSSMPVMQAKTSKMGGTKAWKIRGPRCLFVHHGPQGCRRHATQPQTGWRERGRGEELSGSSLGMPPLPSSPPRPAFLHCLV